MVQPSGVPRFNEDSALKKHWPLIWLTGLSALVIGSFVADFNVLGRSLDNQATSRVSFSTNYIYSKSQNRSQYGRLISPGGLAKPTAEEKLRAYDEATTAFARAVAREAPDTEANRGARVEIKDYLKWFYHRKLGLYFVEHNDYEAAQREFDQALNYGVKLGTTYPCRAISLGELAMLSEIRSVEMQQAAQMLLGAALPIFSFLAAVLPFALFISFIKSRDKLQSSREESETAGARLCLKAFLLASWFGVIVTGWVALRNYGMGLASGWSDPSAVAFLASLGALMLACSMLLRYMPPYKAISFKRTLVGFGFGGVILALKAVAIYLGLCFSLAGHPALKEVLFCEPLYLQKAAQARNLADSAVQSARLTMGDLPFLQEQLINDMSRILIRPRSGDVVDKSMAEVMRSELHNTVSEDIHLQGNNKVPYLWRTFVITFNPFTGNVQPINVQQMTVGMTVKACLAYLLLFYPECLAYLLLGLRKQKWALATFNLAVQVKEYFLGVNHWLVIGMMELFGSCLLTFHKRDDLSEVGEEYLREAIRRYERSRGRHDQLTIAAKMALAHFYSERGDDKQAELVLLEALRDVGTDFDIMAYCALLSELGKLFNRRGNYSRAKQMYKQVIDLLEQRLSKSPPSRGVVGWVRNIYATIPSWQLETKLVLAYLDLAAVFHKAKYNGEAQRLTEDASKRISAFEADICVTLDVASAYYKARNAQSKILCEQGRYDECIKNLAATKKQVHRWGYGRSLLFFEHIVTLCEIELAASKNVPKYFDNFKKDYYDASMQFGRICGLGELGERWRVLGEQIYGKTAVKKNVLAQKVRNLDSEPLTSMDKSISTSWFSVATDGQAENSDAAVFDWLAGRRAESPGLAASGELNTKQAAPETRAKVSASELDFNRGSRESRANFNASETRASQRQQSAAQEKAKLEKGTAENSGSKVSQVIKESRENQDEGMIIRWQRERKEEVMFELRPERG